MASRDILSELHNFSVNPPSVTSKESKSSSSLELSVLNPYVSIDNNITIIEDAVIKLKECHIKNKTYIDNKTRDSITQDITYITHTVTTLCLEIKQTFDLIKHNLQPYSQALSDRIAINIYHQRIQKFQQLMSSYNTAYSQFKTESNDRSKRELRILDPSLSDNDLTIIIEEGRVREVMQKVLISDNLKNAVKVIEDRHSQILTLERNVREIFELFQDLSVMVDEQQEQLNVIEGHVTKARNHTEKAEIELVEAHGYAKKYRERQCCCLLIILGIIIVVLAPTLTKTYA